MSRMFDKYIDEWKSIVNSSSSRRGNGCIKLRTYTIYSKGNYLKPVIPGRLGASLHIFSEKGATIHSNIINKVIPSIQAATSPIVLLWFDTCEISKKDGRYSDIIKYPYQSIEQTLTEYRAVKDRILQNNPSATVIAIECSYFSLYRWNQSRGFNYNTQTTQLYKDIDLKLKSAINYYNQQLSYFNRNILAPHIAQDQIISSKQRKRSRTQNKISFKSLFDGIHPRRPISRLWIHRMVKLARNLRNPQ
ncbi:unnamed protein product [Mytilus coruscus]|uniref:Uncharacterized protein n=1 Tax=Mytilus coruscus TaxID=42192 RepID=A0A6J8D254_MYTCO|nr:unnamed protein product [Mytilus coruscus]